MKPRVYYLINGITLYRLVAVPLLLTLIYLSHFSLFKWLLVLSFLTDAIDGFLARYFKIVSIFGARLDSIGDDLTVFVAIVGVVVVDIDFLKEQHIYVSILLVLFLCQIGIALIKYHKPTGFHTYAGKTAAVLQAIFLILFFFVGPLYSLFYLTMFVTAIDLVEEIIMVLMLSNYQTDIKGIYWLLKKMRSGPDD